MKNNTLKNRGALSNPEGRFETLASEAFDDGWFKEEEEGLPIETIIMPEAAKSILTKNDSPDLGFEQSINPYRGCEHGCIYCYARPSHGYVNLSAGIDFETKIFYKKDAVNLLEKELNAKKYQCKPIMIGANTDPYQPAEAKLKQTRSILELLNKYNHPFVIISKNALMARDLDILKPMAERNLVRVAVSVTSLSLPLKSIMEPRTSSPSGRLKLIKVLAENNIPVRAMVAPVIPFINDMELEAILQKVSEAGAKHASYVFIRLPHEVKDLFKEWLQQHFPQKAEHVMSIIRQMRGGKEYDSTFGKRMRGEGVYADLLAKRFRIACDRFQLNNKALPALDLYQFKKKVESQQLCLWDDFD